MRERFELAELQKLQFRRVLVNPVALRRYLNEFYAVGRSLAGAAANQRSDPIESSATWKPCSI